jgi:hypothetical protein
MSEADQPHQQIDVPIDEIKVQPGLKHHERSSTGKDANAAARYYFPGHRDNPLPGYPTIETHTEASQPQKMAELFAWLKNEAEKLDLPSEYVYLKEKYLAALAEITEHCRAGLNWAETRNKLILRHEETHAIQESRLKIFSLIRDAKSLSHSEEAQKYPSAKLRLEVLSEEVQGLTELQAHTEQNRISGRATSPEELKIMGEVILMSWYRLLRILQTDFRQGSVLENELRTTGSHVPLFRDEPRAEQTLAHLMIATGRADLISLIHGKQISFDTLRTEIVRNLEEAIDHPESIVTRISSLEFRLATDLELMSKTQELKNFVQNFFSL